MDDGGYALPYANEYLTALADHLLPSRSLLWHSDLFPISVIASLHALRTAMIFRREHLRGDRLPYLQGLFTMTVLSMGGSTVSAFLFGRPPDWILSNVVFPLYAAVYTVLFYSPGDLVYRILDFLFPVIDLILIPADAASRTFASTVAGVDFVRHSQRTKGSTLAALLAGTLAGCGGGIVADALSLTSWNWSLRTPQVLIEPSLDVRGVFYGTLLYLVATDPLLWYGRARSIIMQVLGREADQYVRLLVPYQLTEDDAKAATFVLICAFLYWKRLFESSSSTKAPPRKTLSARGARPGPPAGASPFAPGTIAAAERAAAAASLKKTR